MKSLIIGAFVFLLFPASMIAQKFAYVDTKYILMHMPDYASAQNQLNRLSSQWQEEIEAKLENVQRLEDAYEAEEVLLPADMKTKRREEIEQKKQEAREMQKSRFGVNGELFTQREQLIKPVQESIFEAIKEVSSSKGYMVIFDKNNQSNMLYTNPKHDVSDDVLRKMGLTPGEMIEQEEKGDKGGDSKGGASDKGGKSGGVIDAGSKSPTAPRGGKK